MSTTHPTFDLDRFLESISSRLNLAGSLMVNRPSEAAGLDAIPPSQLEKVAAKHGLRVIRRMGGSQFEFTRRPLFHFPYKTLTHPRST